eukprot:jgi/Tetstr1/443581/TSEL_031580.t1
MALTSSSKPFHGTCVVPNKPRNSGKLGQAEYRFIKRDRAIGEGKTTGLSFRRDTPEGILSCAFVVDSRGRKAVHPCCKGSKCLFRLIGSPFDPSAPTAVEARCRDEFLFDVLETRKEVHAEGQNRSRDILASRLKLAFQPEESSPSFVECYSYIETRDDSESKQQWWWKRPNGTFIRTCREAWKFIHHVSERRLSEIQRDVLDDPIPFKRAKYSRKNRDLFVCEIDGMDQDKTRLPHLVPWDKEVEKKNLLQCHLTCVKYNGSQPDDVYYFFDCFPHDSSNTITVMYKTIKKEIERRGEALDTVWFQLDNTCRENKNKHTHERVDQVFSKFSVWLDDHAAFTKAQLLHELRQAFTPTCNFMELEGVLDIKTWLGNCLPRQGQVLNTVTSNQFVIKQSEAVVGGVRSALYCSRWSDTAEHGPEFILRGVPDGTPAYLASRPLYHSKADPGKAFADMEKEIWKAADRLHFSADERREWEEEFASLRELETRDRTPFLAFWPESTTELDTWLGALLPDRDLDADDPMSARMRSQPRLDQTCQGMARRYADLQEELRVLTYNPITINTSTQRRKRRRGAQAATTAVEHSNEAEEGGHAVAIPLENEDTTRREFDARPGNLVVMDNTADNPDAYREEGLLGDWENKYLVAYVRYRYDVQDLDGLPEDHTEVDELDVTMCEPWLSTPHGKPDIPLTFAIAAARQSRDPEPDSSWDAAKKMKWLPITTMPLSLFSLRFPNVRRTARQCQHDFRGTKLTAVTSMKGVSEIKDSRHKNLVVRRPLAKLRYTMQLQEEANRECGASLPLDGIRHMEITYELARLRAALNVHKLDVDNKRRWFNDHRFNADEKKCVLDMLTI